MVIIIEIIETALLIIIWKIVMMIIIDSWTSAELMFYSYGITSPSGKNILKNNRAWLTAVKCKPVLSGLGWP